MVGTVESVNVALPRPVTFAREVGQSAIDKQPVSGRVRVSTLGLAGDRVGDPNRHGGADQAVYAYAREDAAWWAAELGREIEPGNFGENLSTRDLDITDALIGEQWAIGSAVLQICLPRIPCHVFAGFLEVPDLVKRFTARAVPGAYLRVLAEGELGAGDEIRVLDRPDHGITVGLSFRAFMFEPDLIPAVVDVPALGAKARDAAARRLGRNLQPPPNGSRNATDNPR